MQLSATSAASSSVGSRLSPFLSTDHHHVNSVAFKTPSSPLNWTYNNNIGGGGSLLICRSSLTPPNRPSSPSPAAANASESAKAQAAVVVDLNDADNDIVKQARRSADWKAARAHLENGIVYQGRVEGSNGGGLLIRFYSLVGFLPYPQLSPSHYCKEPDKTIQEIAKALAGSLIAVKVILAEEEKRKLIFSEKEAAWSKYSNSVKIGNVYDAKVGSVEDYGAFAHLQFPDGLYHLTGLVHVSEVSWDLVQDVRDILNEGDDVKVKVIGVDRNKSRITLSIKQLEEDPLLETLEKVIPQDGSDVNSDYVIEPLQGLETIVQELLLEDGIIDVKITRQGFEKRVVSQDLQLWLSNAPPNGNQFTLLARAGRQVQEIQLVTSLNQDGIKTALQRVLERVP
ncbi:ribosomal protein S1, RNA-binding domain, S1 [Artemisia annua]|uniref:Ribosomal protein S1, RNA-binding domain, S1 n=1 Tax=Artemisia annua TaxID=35608 RepID=A0A2U1QHW8_ARTAN|nr:ribosomal protein S1, RNA-binding domain, S1 [Artemisia annua]